MIDKSIRQHYENGKEVDPYAGGKKTIWDPIKQKYFPQDETGLDERQLLKNVAGSAAKNLVTSKLTSKLAGTGLLSSLGPIGALLAMFLARKGISKGQKYLTQKGGALQAFQTGFGSLQEGRELRKLEARRANLLQRKEEGRNYSEKDLGIVTRAVAEAKGLDINNPNEMKNIDKPIPIPIQERDFQKQDPDFGVGSSGKVSFAGIQYDKEHGAGSYKDKTIRNRISNIVQSGSTSDIAIDKINKLAEQLDYGHEGSISTTRPSATVADTAAMEDIITAPPKPAPRPAPVRHHTGGGGNGGGMGKGQDPGGGAAGSPFAKGGRVDKALGGRSRDI